MSAAVWGFLGVVLGGVLTGAVSLWQAQLMTKREREARATLREQERKDRRDAFQRETLLALQDATHVVLRLLHVEEERRSIEARTSGTSCPPQHYQPAWGEALQQTSRLQARIFDDQLRPLVREFRGHAGDAFAANTEAEISAELAKALELNRRMNLRIGELLPDLF